MTKNQTLTKIARTVLRVPTLKSRNADHLDFYELSCWTLQAALDLAYDAGRKAATKRGKK